MAAAPATKEPESKPVRSLFWKMEQVLVCPLYRVYIAFQRTVNAAISSVLQVMRFFMVIIQTVLNIYDHAAMLIAFSSDCARGVRNFDFSGFVVRLSTLPRTYYGKCKVMVKKTLWKPIFDTMSNAAHRISRYFKALVRKYVIYLRGFAELCRRLFLLASDFVPGGQITVTAFLLFMAVMFIVKLFSFIQLFLQLAEFAYGIIVFFLHPLVLTVKDILAVLDPLLQVLYLLARIVLYAIISALQAVAIFIWLNLVSITSGLYKCWQRFFSSKVMKIVCSLLAKAFYIFLEKFVYVFLPFMTRTSCVGLNFLFDISCVAYKNFFVITIDSEKFENLTASAIASTIFIFWALILAFRLRKRFSEKARSEVDDSYPDVIASNPGGIQADAIKTDSRRIRTSASRRTTMYDSSRRATRSDEDTVVRYRGKAVGDGERENFPDDSCVGHIHFSALAHICTGFIKGSCQKGKECDNHHCSLPYQWQYRPSLDGWTSFVAEDNERIECLFCDPNKNVVTINEINVVLKSYRTRTTTSSSIEPVKLDFENMRLEKSYQRADLRRLSTESKVKENESKFATQWLWYKEIDNEKWIKYGEQGELGDVAQEDIESAFLRREREYVYTKNNQEFRVHFLTPMCERSFRPYLKKVVRRRPLFRSAEVVKKLKETASSSNRLSIKRFFSWL